jgi:ABC-type multidrug transport system ATPase subunit
VDANVGKTLFFDCICRTLKDNGKAVVLATHQLQYLPYADKILSLSSDGRQTFYGTYEELQTHEREQERSKEAALEVEAAAEGAAETEQDEGFVAVVDNPAIAIAVATGATMPLPSDSLTRGLPPPSDALATDVDNTSPATQQHNTTETENKCDSKVEIEPGEAPSTAKRYDKHFRLKAARRERAAHEAKRRKEKWLEGDEVGQKVLDRSNLSIHFNYNTKTDTSSSNYQSVTADTDDAVSDSGTTALTDLPEDADTDAEEGKEAGAQAEVDGKAREEENGREADADELAESSEDVLRRQIGPCETRL